MFNKKPAPSKRIEFDEDGLDEEEISTPSDYPEVGEEETIVEEPTKPQSIPRSIKQSGPPMPMKKLPMLPRTYIVKSIPTSIELKIVNQKTNEELDLYTALAKLLNDVENIKEKVN